MINPLLFNYSISHNLRYFFYFFTLLLTENWIAFHCELIETYQETLFDHFLTFYLPNNQSISWENNQKTKS